MPVQTRTPGSWTSADLVGGAEWLNPNEAAVEDAEYTFALVQAQSNSDYLRGTNCGFTIPTGSRIDGIEVRVKRAADAAGDIFDAIAQLIPGPHSGTLDSEAWIADTFTFHTYGSPTDDWGGTWTPSNINDSGFGFELAVDNFDNLIENQPWVDYVEIKVYYTEPGVCERTGSVVMHSSGANSGSTSVTVPPDADGVLLFTGGYVNDGAWYTSPGAAPSLGGTAMERVTGCDGFATSDHQHGVWWLPNPAAGSQTFAWDWGAGTLFDGLVYLFVFVKGNFDGDVAAVVRDTYTTQLTANGISTDTMTAQTGDLFLGWREGFNAGTESYSWTNATSFYGLVDTLGTIGTLGEAAPTGNIQATGFVGYANGDGGLAALVLKPAAGGGGGGPSYAPAIIGQTQGRRW